MRLADPRENGMVAERRPELASVREDREAARQRRAEAAKTARWNVLHGRDCSFWNGPDYDNDQQVRLFAAVKLASSLIAVSDADRWRSLAGALYDEALRYGEVIGGDL